MVYIANRLEYELEGGGWDESDSDDDPE